MKARARAMLHEATDEFPDDRRLSLGQLEEAGGYLRALAERVRDLDDGGGDATNLVGPDGFPGFGFVFQGRAARG